MLTDRWELCLKQRLKQTAQTKNPLKRMTLSPQPSRQVNSAILFNRLFIITVVHRVEPECKLKSQNWCLFHFIQQSNWLSSRLYNQHPPPSFHPSLTLPFPHPSLLHPSPPSPFPPLPPSTPPYFHPLPHSTLPLPHPTIPLLHLTLLSFIPSLPSLPPPLCHLHKPLHVMRWCGGVQRT